MVLLKNKRLKIYPCIFPMDSNEEQVRQRACMRANHFSCGQFCVTPCPDPVKSPDVGEESSSRPGAGLGFPGGSDGKESACNAGDLGLIPRLGRFFGRKQKRFPGQKNRHGDLPGGPVVETLPSNAGAGQ